MEKVTQISARPFRTAEEGAALAVAYVMHDPTDRWQRQLRSLENVEVEPSWNSVHDRNIVVPSSESEAQQARLNNAWLDEMAEKYPRLSGMILQHVVEIAE